MSLFGINDTSHAYRIAKFCFSRKSLLFSRVSGGSVIPNRHRVCALPSKFPRTLLYTRTWSMVATKCFTHFYVWLSANFYISMMYIIMASSAIQLNPPERWWMLADRHSLNHSWHFDMGYEISSATFGLAATRIVNKSTKPVLCR